MPADLDDVDRAIVGALQVDGRASWRRIAGAIDVPVSTVTRRGSALLESGIVRVGAIELVSESVIAEVRVVPGRQAAVAEQLAAMPNSTFVYRITPPDRLIAEMTLPSGLDEGAVLDAIAAIPGAEEATVASAMEYHRTVTEWMPHLISDASARALRETFGRPIQPSRPPSDAADAAIVDALMRDGRMPVEALAAQARVSMSSVRRRLAGLLGRSVDVRAVVDPADIGFPVSALLRVAAAPADLAAIIERVRAHPHVRYAVLTTGAEPLLVDVAVPRLDDVAKLVRGDGWTASASRVVSSRIVAAYKRGGILLR